MTALHLADEGEAADLAAFLARLIHYDRAAAVRLQAGGGRRSRSSAGRRRSRCSPIRTVRLAEAVRERLDLSLDVTVSAGELLESLDEAAATAAVPAAVTGPPWAGVLPPRGGWRPEPGLPGPDAVRAMVAAAVAEFRSRIDELAPEGRTRAELDRIGREIWSRPVGDTELPRAGRARRPVAGLPAARAPGRDRRPRPTAEAVLRLLSSGAWLRLRTPYGSIAVRRAGLGALDVSVR